MIVAIPRTRTSTRTHEYAQVEQAFDVCRRFAPLLLLLLFDDHGGDPLVRKDSFAPTAVSVFFWMENNDGKLRETSFVFPFFEPIFPAAGADRLILVVDP